VAGPAGAGGVGGFGGVGRLDGGGKSGTDNGRLMSSTGSDSQERKPAYEDGHYRATH